MLPPDVVVERAFRSRHQLQDLPERVRRDGGDIRLPDSKPPGEELPTDYRDHVRKFEVELIVQALHRFDGNQTEAAKALGLPLRTLVHKIQRYGIKKKFGH